MLQFIFHQCFCGMISTNAYKIIQYDVQTCHVFFNSMVLVNLGVPNIKTHIVVCSNGTLPPTVEAKEEVDLLIIQIPVSNIY